MAEIRKILEFDTAGDPVTGRIWTRMTPEKIARCLEECIGLSVSATTVHRLLTQLQYSLKGNKKSLSCGFHPDRDQQFLIIQQLREQFMAAGDPIISVDTKKKELIGLFKNPGRTWCREAKEVKDHDFRSEAEAIASPYGIYDVLRNCGTLIVGRSSDTPEFAVNCIATWWIRHGKCQYPSSSRLLILADSGGSNGARPRAFKKFLQERMADRFGIELLVSHYPTGASKWNPIEHRMFSEISKNWAGQPLESFTTLLNFARHTKTDTGLKVEAYFDPREYEKGIKVPDKEFKRLNIVKNKTLGNWNYTITPRSSAVAESHGVDTFPFLNTEHDTEFQVAV
jgi:hypothetical protein